MRFSYLNPTTIVFGQNQINSISHMIDKSQKVLVIYGSGSIKKNGVYQQIALALEGYEWQEFSGVGSNPTKEKMDEAVTLIKEQKIDFILAVGGGSVVDGSKYAAAAAHYNGDGWDIMIGRYQPRVALPIGVILTIPATGSESNTSFVITKAKTNEKITSLAGCVQPRFAVMDPDVMKTLPDKQLTNGIVDAWVHVCEQYLTKPRGALVQDGYSEALLRTLKTLGDTYHDHDNDTWRSNLMWAANQALNGLIAVGVEQDWATHMIGHELTAIWHVDHARSLSIIQPSLLRNQIKYKRGKLEQMGRNVFGFENSPDLAERTIDAIETFYLSLGLPVKLQDYGCSKDEAIDAVVSKLEHFGMKALTENRTVTPSVVREILDEAIV